MKWMKTLFTEEFAKSAAGVMTVFCYLTIFFYSLCMILSLIGRQSFCLHTKTGIFERAIYAENDHTVESRSMTVSLKGDEIHVWTNENDQIEITIQIGLFLLYAIHTIPLIAAFWFLSRVFANISQGAIFVEQNAACLLYYGLFQFFAAVFVPFIKLLICHLISLVSGGQMSISTGHSMFNLAIPGIAFIIAAYIIQYGVHLQDEVDHTL